VGGMLKCDEIIKIKEGDISLARAAFSGEFNFYINKMLADFE
jgi:hypothetical protein